MDVPSSPTTEDSVPLSPNNTACINLSSSLSKLKLPDDLLSSSNSSSGAGAGDTATNSDPPPNNNKKPATLVQSGPLPIVQDPLRKANRRLRSHSSDSAPAGLAVDHTPPPVSPRMEQLRKRSRSSGHFDHQQISPRLSLDNSSSNNNNNNSNSGGGGSSSSRHQSFDDDNDVANSGQSKKRASADSGSNSDDKPSHTILFNNNSTGRTRTSSFSGSPELQVGFWVLFFSVFFFFSILFSRFKVIKF